MTAGRVPAGRPAQRLDLAPQLLKLAAAVATPAVLVVALCVMVMRIHSADGTYSIAADGKLITAQVRPCGDVIPHRAGPALRISV